MPGISFYEKKIFLNSIWGLMGEYQEGHKSQLEVLPLTKFRIIETSKRSIIEIGCNTLRRKKLYITMKIDKALYKIIWRIQFFKIHRMIDLGKRPQIPIIKKKKKSLFL